MENNNLEKGLNNSVPAVITGFCDSMSLYLVRSLGRKGIPVYAIDSTITDYYNMTKYCQKIYCKSLYDSTLIDSLCELGESFEEKAVLFNCTDQSLLNVSKERDRLEQYYNIVIPSHAAIISLMSKKNLYKFTIENKFIVPVTYFSKYYEEITKISNSISYPCIIKPEFRDKNWWDKVSDKVIYADSKENLLNQIEKYKIDSLSLVFQEFIEGGDSDLYFCLTYISRNRNPLAFITGRKLRQYPHLAGTLSVAETVHRPELVKETLRFLSAANCVGYCSLEFKRSRTDGKFYVIEPTIGRPDSQEELFYATDLNIPYMAYLDAIGKISSNKCDFKAGAKWIDMPRAIHLIIEFFQNKITVKELYKILKGRKVYSLWALDDPMPAINFIKYTIIKEAKRWWQNI